MHGTLVLSNPWQTHSHIKYFLMSARSQRAPFPEWPCICKIVWWPSVQPLCLTVWSGCKHHGALGMGGLTEPMRLWKLRKSCMEAIFKRSFLRNLELSWCFQVQVAAWENKALSMAVMIRFVFQKLFIEITLIFISLCSILIRVITSNRKQDN